MITGAFSELQFCGTKNSTTYVQCDAFCYNVLTLSFLLILLFDFVNYKRLLFDWRFQLTVNNKHLGVFMNTFNLESLINKPTCFQSANPTCIDLILTNKKSLFKNSNVLEVGISDHHSFITTALRTQLIKGNAKMKMYRDYKTFNIDFFKRDLRESLENHTSYDYSCFQNIFIALLNKHAPIKKKIMRFNNNPFMSKALRKAIMHRSKLKNIYNNYRTEDNWANYKKQRNFCVNLLRKTKTEYFQKLNVKDLSDNKKFWKTIKPFFSNKGLNSNKLMLKENRIITEEKELDTVMNTFFVNITESLDLKKDDDSSLNPINSNNINHILEKHKNHLSHKKLVKLL